MAPSHCMHSQQSGQQSATLLRSGSGPRQAVLTAVICLGLCASEEWGFAYMLRSGSKLVSACNLTLPLVAACSCACVLRAFPAGIARLRDRIRRLRATCISKDDQQIMQSMIILVRPKHISVRNPQAPGPRSRSARCSRRRRYDARIPPIFANRLRSSVLCIQCRQARGGIPLVAISVRACMPGQRILRLTNSARACPQRTQTAPIYSAQFPPSVRKRTKVGRELRDPTQRVRSSDLTPQTQPVCVGVTLWTSWYRVAKFGMYALEPPC